MNGFHSSGIDSSGIDSSGIDTTGKDTHALVAVGGAGAGDRVADAIWRFWSAPEGGGPWPMAAFRPRARGVKMGPGRLACARPFAAR